MDPKRVVVESSSSEASSDDLSVDDIPGNDKKLSISLNSSNSSLSELTKGDDRKDSNGKSNIPKADGTDKEVVKNSEKILEDMSNNTHINKVNNNKSIATGSDTDKNNSPIIKTENYALSDDNHLFGVDSEDVGLIVLEKKIFLL